MLLDKAMQHFERFIQEKCTIGSELKVPSSIIFRDYHAYASEREEYVFLNNAMFTVWIKENCKDIIVKKMHGGTWFSGLTLKDPVSQEEIQVKVLQSKESSRISVNKYYHNTVKVKKVHCATTVKDLPKILMPPLPRPL